VALVKMVCFANNTPKKNILLFLMTNNWLICHTGGGEMDKEAGNDLL